MPTANSAIAQWCGTVAARGCAHMPTDQGSNPGVVPKKYPSVPAGLWLRWVAGPGNGALRQPP